MKLKNLFLFIGMTAYKLATEWGYFFILSGDAVTYPIDFNVWKYINGWLWCVILFLGIRHERKKASVFMLYMLYISQIIPITCVYALANDSAVYYNLTCLAVLSGELLSGWTSSKERLHWNGIYSKILMGSFVIALAIMLFSIFKRNGLPSLTALDIYKVYELRREGVFQIGKYGNYMLSWMLGVIIPFLIAVSIEKRSYIKSAMFCIIVFILYLYTGHKSYAFSIPLIFMCALWIKRRDAYREIYVVFSFGFAFLVVLSCFSPILKGIFFRIYSLIGRRVFLVSAVNKFKYYDFFSNNFKFGLAGIFPRWILPIQNPYEGINIPHMIAEIYYNKPEMGSNTGFLAEGYMRFGYIGIFIVIWVYTAVIKLMDRMQERVGYNLTVSAFVYPMLMLTDSHLIDSLVLGKYMFMVIIMVFYGWEKRITNYKFSRSNGSNYEKSRNP